MRRAAARLPACLPLPCRYETAAGFFLLAGCVRDAVGVLAKECADPQLALFVARLVEGTQQQQQQQQQGRVAAQLLQQVRSACAVWVVA